MRSNDSGSRLTCLAKLRGDLTPAQMETDLVLERAPDDEPCRELRITW